jgi:hypothetical protein
MDGKRKMCQDTNRYACKKRRIRTGDEDFNWVKNFGTGCFLNKVECEVVACPGMYWKYLNQCLSVLYHLHSILTEQP